MVDTTKILKQVEFYFSDSNLPRDKFLKEEISKNNGGVAVSTIASFARIKALTENQDTIIEALKDSKLVRVTEDKMIQRITPIPDVVDRTLMTIFCKGFPETATLDQLEEFYNDCAPVKSIRMLRDKKSKAFIGNCFVEFDTAENAERVSKLDLVFEEAKIEMMMKTEYEAKRNAEKKSQEKPAKELEKYLVKGCLVVLDNVPTDMHPKEIRKAVSQHGNVAFVQVDEESKSAMCRFRDPVAAQVVQLCTDGIKLQENTVTMRVATEEEETEYEAKMDLERAQAHASGVDPRNRKRKGNFGKKGSKRQNQEEKSEVENVSEEETEEQ